MKKLINFCMMLVLFLVVSMFPTGEALAVPNQLKVGLYPYVPRIEQFEQAIKESWKKAEPDIKLVFEKEWDGGYGQDPEDLDVFVFDAIYFKHFEENGWLEPINKSEIGDIKDFFPFAIKGVESPGDFVLAIPQLGCANILFYRKDDSALQKANSLNDIKNALGECKYTSKIPPKNEGLMLDMKGGTTNAALYLDTVHSINGEYPLFVPESEKDLNEEGLENMATMLKMASYLNAKALDPKEEDFSRAEWFDRGYGRALIGYTEAMSRMSPGTIQNLDFKVMPLSDKELTTAPNLFYADVIAVNKKASDERKTYAKKLAILMAGTDTMVESIKGEGDKLPQYLLPTRWSVLWGSGYGSDIIHKMKSLIQSDDLMFKVPVAQREKLKFLKEYVPAEVASRESCGCDYLANERINSQSDALQICPVTCSACDAAWNGQWTNEEPMAPQGNSVCGCSKCPI